MQLLRIPVLVAILVASGPLQWRYAQQRFVFTADGAVSSIPPWLALMALAVVFILAASYRRDRRHATPILVLEGLVALIITIVPPLIWAQVAGAGAWTTAMGGTTGSSFAQILAVVWLVTVGRTLRGQRRA
jgi:predicted Co/Zn/Cd cation transporter (cation efflux family)